MTIQEELEKVAHSGDSREAARRAYLLGLARAKEAAVDEGVPVSNSFEAQMRGGFNQACAQIVEAINTLENEVKQ